MRGHFVTTVFHPSQLICRVAHVLAIVGLLLISTPRLAAAQGFTVPDSATQDFAVLHDARAVDGQQWAPLSPTTVAPQLALRFTRLQCVEEGGAWYEQIAGSDEPYVLIFAVSLHSPKSGRLARTRIFSDVDNGESRSASVPVWGGLLSDPDDLVVLVQIMEHDESDVGHLVSVLQSRMPDAAAAAVAAGLGHDAIVSRLKTRMQSLIDNNKIPQKLGSLNMDDRIGGVKEVRITPADVAATSSGPVQKRIDVTDSSDGDYRAFFELTRR
jgi:hypothetical protein